MRHLIYLAITALFLAPAFVATTSAEEAAATDTKKVTEAKQDQVAIFLKDKSTIVGTIKSLKDGVYEVETEGLGTVKIATDRIAGIDYEPNKSVAAPQAKAKPQSPLAATDTAGQVEAFFNFENIMQALTSDPAMMQKIQELANDPDFQAIMNDPEIQKAIENGNFVALGNNQKLWKLMENPKVKEITQSFTEKQ